MKKTFFFLFLMCLSAACGETALFETPFNLTGTGSDYGNRRHSSPVALDGATRYFFSFTARRLGSGSGTVVSGPSCANVDWDITDPVAAPYAFVFRTPVSSGPINERFHLGGWRMKGELVFEAASVRRVKAQWYRSGDLELGHGEQIDGNRYLFSTQLGGDARNDARVLHEHKAGFNTDRWCLYRKAYITYRHELAARKFRSGKITVRCGWYQAGTAAVEVSRDTRQWTALGTIGQTGVFTFDVPQTLCPADALYVRLRGLDKASLQVQAYAFEGLVDGPQVSVCGATRYIDEKTGELFVNMSAPSFYNEDYGEQILNVGDVTLWRASAAHKIPRGRNVPRETLPAGEGLVIRTAAHEAEAQQLVVSPRKALSRVRVTCAGDLVATNGARLAAHAVDIRRVGYVFVEQPTDAAGCRAFWPDPLLPQTADGCSIKAHENQPFRVRVKPPKGTPKGVYRGALRLSSDDGVVEVPFAVEVFGFALPDKMTCETAFGFQFSSVTLYHKPRTAEQRRILLGKYLQLLSDNHVSPYNPAPLSPWRVTWKGIKENPQTAEPVFDWTAWDAAMEKAFDVYHFNTVKLPIMGLGGGTFHARTPPSIQGIPATNALYHVLMGRYLGAIEAHLREKGWLDKAYVYWFDEPDAKDYPFVMEGFRTLKRHAPGLRRMLTEQPDTALLGGPNVWCPLTPHLNAVGTPACREAGDTFWWYVCCGPRAPYVTEFIDHPGVEMRLWSWQTWKEQVHGLLIWATCYWTSQAAYPDSLQNPYEDPMSWVSGYATARGVKKAWGNGDGRLVYPPPAAVDNPSGAPVMDDPVPTFRLEMLADGIEDYEYFAQLKRLLAKASPAVRARYEALLKVPETVTKSMKEFSVDPGPLERHRLKLARALEALTAAAGE